MTAFATWLFRNSIPRSITTSCVSQRPGAWDGPVAPLGLGVRRRMRAARRRGRAGAARARVVLHGRCDGAGLCARASEIAVQDASAQREERRREPQAVGGGEVLDGVEERALESSAEVVRRERGEGALDGGGVADELDERARRTRRRRPERGGAEGEPERLARAARREEVSVDLEHLREAEP